MYSWNTQKISINDNGKIKTISPFFLVSDDKAHLFDNGSYTNLGSIFNVEELKAISENIEAVTGDIRDVIASKTEQLINMQEQLDSVLNKLSIMDDKMEELENIKNKYLEMLDKSNEYYNKVSVEMEEYIDKYNIFQKSIDEKIKEAEFSYNKAKVNISDLMEQAENKTAAKYTAFRLKMDNIYNKYINEVINRENECKKYAQTSKKWASNPINLPVEDGKYSARHYALLNKNQGVANE